jgi:radical SAM protein with 4Fe4S-binding SPASM domain
MAGDSFPAQVQLMLTERCNLQCAHCAVPTEDSPADYEIRTDEWRRFIDVLAAAGVDDLVVSGGEALLRRDALSLIRHAHQAGIRRTTLITNGMRFGRRVNEEIVAIQAEYDGFGVHVSIDGASPQTHDWMRGNGSFQAIKSGIDALLGAGGRITGVHTVFHRGNLHELQDVAKLVREVGASTWTLFPIASVGRGRAIQDFALGREEWEQIYAFAAQAAASFGLDVAPMGPILVDEWPTEPGTLVPTGRAAVSSRVCVGPDGAVFSCPPLRGIEIANSTAVAGADDWARAAAAGRSLVEQHCPTCRFRFLCTGGEINAPQEVYLHLTPPVDPSATAPVLAPRRRPARVAQGAS